MASIGLEGEELIVPAAIPMPGVAAEELRSTAKSLKDDGQDTADIGQAIRRTWQLLQGFYRAPESGQLLIAADPVADGGEEISDDLGTVAGALSDFADDAERIEKWLKHLKADAEALVDDAGEHWQFDPVKVAGNLALKAAVNKAVAAFQEAERECANKITRLFDGPTFVPDDGGTVKDGQLAYGMAKDAPDTRVGALDVWGTGRGLDLGWWYDAANAQADMALKPLQALSENAVRSVGIYGDDGWTTSPGEIVDNAIDHRIESLKGSAALIGVSFDKDGTPSWGLDTFGSAWGEVANGFTAWKEFGERPAYTIYTTAGNVLSLLAGGGGAVRGAASAGSKMAKGLRGHHGHRGPDGPEAAPHANKPNGPRTPAGLGKGPQEHLGPTARQLQQDVEKFHHLSEKLGDYDKAFAEWQKSKTPDLEPVGADARGGHNSPTALPGNHGGRHIPTDNAPAGRNSGSHLSSDASDSAPKGGNSHDRSNELPSVGRSETGSGAGPTDHGRTPLGTNASLDSSHRGETDTSDNSASGGEQSSTQGSEGPHSTKGHGNHANGDDGAGSDDGNHRPRSRPGGSDGTGDILDVERLNEGPGRGFFDQEGNFVDKGHRDDAGNYYDESGNKFVSIPENEWTAKAYEEIRGNSGDAHSISQNTQIDQNVLDRMKNHLFLREHSEVACPPDGQLRDGRFSPMEHVADLWLKAEKGTLSDSDATRFRHLVMHEAVESRLMERGMPYRHRDPDAWDDGTYWPSKERHGAHDISPLEHNHNNPFVLWDKYGYGRPSFDLADDLSNIDAYAEHILKVWKE
ncbi:hypothetical protein NOGI109294_26325 [Nocardiopsis gilva]|uniref:hypothetical protein n=1 Tax=Nocardiopsis gilva TaxID=280236 RepID=UPI001267A5C2|nr:hypothetical protein [Nocardiopsis gilva]